MMARRVPGILPPLTFDEAIEVTAVHSVAGFLKHGSGLVADRPFRAPHHTISNVALIGGGSQPRPGEVSLAHHGVLFLDEMLEFHRGVLEVLRQPLEEGHVTIARAARTVMFPARFVLVGAMNPCPCGFAGDPVARMPVHATTDREVSRPHLRTAAGPVGSHRGRAGGSARHSGRWRIGRTLRAVERESSTREAANRERTGAQGASNEFSPHAAN